LIGERLRTVRLRDACMVGPVDLEAVALLCPLLLKDFYFDQPINLNEVTALSISLPDCQVLAIDAAGRCAAYAGAHDRAPLVPGLQG
jgi:hypothetical protein